MSVKSSLHSTIQSTENSSQEHIMQPAVCLKLLYLWYRSLVKSWLSWALTSYWSDFIMSASNFLSSFSIHQFFNKIECMFLCAVWEQMHVNATRVQGLSILQKRVQKSLHFFSEGSADLLFSHIDNQSMTVSEWVIRIQLCMLTSKADHKLSLATLQL